MLLLFLIVRQAWHRLWTLNMRVHIQRFFLWYSCELYDKRLDARKMIQFQRWMHISRERSSKLENAICEVQFANNEVEFVCAFMDEWFVCLESSGILPMNNGMWLLNSKHWFRINWLLIKIELLGASIGIYYWLRILYYTNEYQKQLTFVCDYTNIICG